LVRPDLDFGFPVSPAQALWAMLAHSARGRGRRPNERAGNLPTQTYWFKSEFMNLCEELWGSDLGAFPSLNQCLNYSGAILETCPESKILNDVKMRQAKR
jgi:hypothetical protein